MGIAQNFANFLPIRGLRHALINPAKEVFAPGLSPSPEFSPRYTRKYIEHLLMLRAWQAVAPLEVNQTTHFDHPESPLLQELCFNENQVYIIKLTRHRPNFHNTLRIFCIHVPTDNGNIPVMCFSRLGLAQEIINSAVPFNSIWKGYGEVYQDAANFNPYAPVSVPLGRELYFGESLSGTPTSLLHINTVSREHASLFLTPDPCTLLLQNLSPKGLYVQRIE